MDSRFKTNMYTTVNSSSASSIPNVKSGLVGEQDPCPILVLSPLLARCTLTSVMRFLLQRIPWRFNASGPTMTSNRLPRRSKLIACTLVDLALLQTFDQVLGYHLLIMSDHNVAKTGNKTSCNPRCFRTTCRILNSLNAA